MGVRKRPVASHAVRYLGVSMTLDLLLLTLAAALISTGVFIFSIPAGLVTLGLLLAALVFLYRDAT